MDLIIHDGRFDSSVTFLERLYEGRDVTLLTRADSNAAVRRAIAGADSVTMLGHGSPRGLMSRPDSAYEGFDRALVHSAHVHLLRGKALAGIWCFADRFAERYRLTGLFSGMVVSEILECEWTLGYRPSAENVRRCNALFADFLRKGLDTLRPEEIPEYMEASTPDDDPINVYNFKSLKYLRF